MRIDLKAPTCWTELTTEQLRSVVEMATKELGREEFLLVAFCLFANIKMVAGTAMEDGKKVVRTRFKTADGTVFELEDWQLRDFCERLSFLFEEEIPLDAAWPFRWNRYLMDTSFGDWFHADALLLGYGMSGDLEQIKGAMKDLGDPHYDLQPNDPDVVLMLKWYEQFKNWLLGRYPSVFHSSGSESEPSSPVDARRNIMLMLNNGHPQDNEAIENAKMHDVLAALQHKVEEAKHIEDQMKKMKYK